MPVIEKQLPAKEQRGITAKKSASYTFSNKAKFYMEAANLPHDERAAFEEIGKVIEEKGAITKEEGLRIFSAHYKLSRPEVTFGRRFSDFISKDCLKWVKTEEKMEVKELPAKETFHQFGRKELPEKLFDHFKKMSEKEVDVSFDSHGTKIKVFGFRARKGIVISGDAFVAIAGGKANIHLEKEFANRLQEVINYYEDATKPEAQDKLRKHKEFRNFVSVVDFLKSQNMITGVFISSSGEEKRIRDIRGKYALALRVKTLEKEGLTPEKAVEKVVSESHSTSRVLEQLEEHGLKLEAENLGRKDMSSRVSFDALATSWAKNPPKNLDELKQALWHNDPSEVKKAVEEEIGRMERAVEKMKGEEDSLKNSIKELVEEGKKSPKEYDYNVRKWQYMAGELKEIRDSLAGKEGELGNLKKANEMLEKYGDGLKETPLLEKPKTPTPTKIAEPTPQAKVVLQKLGVKAEIPAALQQKLEKVGFKHQAGRGGRLPLTSEEAEKRKKDKEEKIEAFCKEKGIDIEHHPALYKNSLENLKAIVGKAEEKKIPFTPYRNFLPHCYKSFNKNVQSVEWYNLQVPEESKIDLAIYSGVLVLPSGNLSENLKTCVRNRRDVIKEGLIWHLGMDPEKFNEFLKSHVPPERFLSPEEREKKVIAIMVEKGVEEKDIEDYVKKKHPETIKEIIETCERHNFDWKEHQGIFALGPMALKWKMELCRCNGINPPEITVEKFNYSDEKFKEFVKTMVTQQGREFKELEAH